MDLRTFSPTNISYQAMANSNFKEEIDFKELKKETRASFLCGFLRLYEPKSREGVLGPDLRVLILLEYPGGEP